MKEEYTKYLLETNLYIMIRTWNYIPTITQSEVMIQGILQYKKSNKGHTKDYTQPATLCSSVKKENIFKLHKTSERQVCNFESQFCCQSHSGLSLITRKRCMHIIKDSTALICICTIWCLAKYSQFGQEYKVNLHYVEIRLEQTIQGVRALSNVTMFVCSQGT